MEITNIARDKATIALSADEIGFLGNAINEALEAVEEWEFQTRTGETRTRAKTILAELGKLLDEMRSL